MTQSNQEISKHAQCWNEEHDRSCPICLEEFDKHHLRKVSTTCGHLFCQNCLQKTLKIKPFCPLCRQYQPSDNQSSEPRKLDEHTPWDPQVVRAFFSEERLNENGQPMRTVLLSGGESTNIHVSPSAKINISPDTNLIINGRRIQNPSDCSQQ